MPRGNPSSRVQGAELGGVAAAVASGGPDGHGMATDRALKAMGEPISASDESARTPGPVSSDMWRATEQQDSRPHTYRSCRRFTGICVEPAFTARRLMHGANEFGPPSPCKLDELPPTGALPITPLPKIENGSGSPLRVLALVENQYHHVTWPRVGASERP